MRIGQIFLFTTLLLFYCRTEISAQWDAPVSHYWVVRNFYNPAFAGETESVRTAALYRYQWAGIDNAPQRTIITADMPFKLLNRWHGAGVTAYSENVGSLRNSLLAAQYCFKQKLPIGYLNIGLQAGVHIIGYDAGAIYVETDTEQNNRAVVQPNSDGKKQLADLNAGISWCSSPFYVGISLSHLNQPKFRDEEREAGSIINDSFISNPKEINLSRRRSSIDQTPTEPALHENQIQLDSVNTYIPRRYNFMAGYNINLFPSLDIEPIVWIKYGSGNSQLHTTLRIIYKSRYSGGVTRLHNDGFGFFASGDIEGFKLGYSYSMHSLGTVKKSSGSHELYIKYDFTLNSFKPKRYPQKSIRLL